MGRERKVCSGLGGWPAWAAVASALVLAACSNPFSDDAPTFSELLSAGWLSPEKASPTPPDPLYCYETIGVGDCHVHPVAGEGNRLVGFEGPPPPVEVEP